MDVKYVVENITPDDIYCYHRMKNLEDSLRLKKTLGEGYHIRFYYLDKVVTWSDIIDHFNIGSEGGSAWCWRGDDVNDMRCIGFTGKTRKEALEKLLEAILNE